MIVILAIFATLILGLFLTFGIFLGLRYKKRLNKNLKRGLSMVTLQIHLPPLSEDIEARSRDSRDVLEENISKATTLYSILTSTAEKKDLKIAYYGQEHVGFEIIAKGSEVCFYAVAPQNLVPIIRQAINSAYKSAKVEEVAEHNLFDAKISKETVLGGELVLKRHFAQPIATYLDSRQDIMKSLLGALSDLKETDGVGVQILLRPADESWIKSSQEVAKNIGNKKSSNFFKDFLISFIKAPTSKDKESEAKNKVDMSGIDKKLVEEIEKKISQPGFEVLIRLVVSTTKIKKSQNVYNNMRAAFAILDAPKSNGFKHKKTKDIVKFITDFNLRIFPQGVNKNILSINEMATIFHLPDEENIPTSQLERQASKQVDGPRNFLEEGLLLGNNVFRGKKRKIILGDDDRMRHMYVVGQTGTGKSVFLENLALQDMVAGKGFALVDPHGETAEKVLSRIPEDRLDDVIYFNPGNMDYPMGLNIFEHDDLDKQDFLIQEAIAMLYKLYDPNQQGIMGPRYEHIFRNAAKLIMADPAGGTFIDIPKLFNDRQFVEQKLQHVDDKTVIDFWRKEIVAAERSSDFGDLKNWFVAKFSAFLSNTMMRNILGQNKSSFDLRKIMDEGKIMIINLSYGRTGELNMKLLGMLFVTKFQMAAMSRANVSDDERSDFTLYIDEFQNFATESFAGILSAARKYRLALVVANQHTTQLTEEIRDAVYGNVGTAISFRISAQDADNMVKQFYSPTFEIDNLTRLSVGHTAVRTLINGAPTAPFNMETLAPMTEYDRKAQLKAEKYLFKKHARPRAEVEKEIFNRLEVRTPPSPPVSASLPSPQAPWQPPPQPSQFLNNWLQHKQGLKDELSKKRDKLDKELVEQQSNRAKLILERARLKKVLKKKQAKLGKIAQTKDPEDKIKD